MVLYGPAVVMIMKMMMILVVVSGWRASFGMEPT